MFSELSKLFQADSPVAWVIGSILAIYLAIKIAKDVSQWLQSNKDDKKKEVTEALNRCHVQDIRITKLEQAVETIHEAIDEIKAMIRELKIQVSKI